MDTLPWSVEVRRILNLAGIAEAQLADELSVHRSVVFRYLSGDHKPKLETVHKVNNAVGKLCACCIHGMPRVLRSPMLPSALRREMRNNAEVAITEYLNAVAPERQTTDPAEFLNGIDLGLVFLEPFLRTGAVETLRTAVVRRVIMDTAKKRTRSPANRLGHALMREGRRIILGLMTAQQEVLTPFDSISKIFQEHGFSLCQYLLPENEVARLLAEGRLDAALAAAIRKHAPDISDDSLASLKYDVQLAVEQWARATRLTPTTKGS